MRRLLITALLVLLPLQFSWAAVLNYCVHAPDVQTPEHFGHHDHQGADRADKLSAQAWQADSGAQPEMLSSVDVDSDTAAGVELECGHGFCVNVAAIASMSSPPKSASRMPTMNDASLRAVAQDPPLRPQWAPIA